MENRKPNCSCGVCGKEIYRRPSQMIGNIFCSSLCVGKSQRLNQKKCPVCDTIFVGHKKTCSRSCSNKSRTGIKYDGQNKNNNASKSKILKENLSKTRNGICEECGNEHRNKIKNLCNDCKICQICEICGSEHKNLNHNMCNKCYNKNINFDSI